ncbi:MAG TPA: hypothetical protein EYN91_11395 [Candidatus Melainabacteria bacterium]|nr:hypothetical protein [Candidatus Melainabacteria bacterium]HIN65859.1 hypothetical protein [Candidatus Obscuribacterales bacterium]
MRKNSRASRFAAVMVGLLFLNSHPVFAATEVNGELAYLTEKKAVNQAVGKKRDTERSVLSVIETLMNVGRYQRAAIVLRNEPDCFRNEMVCLPLLINLYAARDYKGLLLACDEWLKLNASKPSKFDSVVYEFMGTIYTEVKEYEKATDAFDRAIAIDPRPRIYSSRAECSLRKGNKGQAVIDASKGAVEEGSSLSTELNMSILQGSILPAIETLSQLNVKPATAGERTRNQIARAELLENAGEFAKAREFYAEASKSLDFDASMWNEYALCVLTTIGIAADLSDSRFLPKNGQCAEVESLLQKAISIDKSDWRLWSNLGLARYLSGDRDRAMEALDKALESRDISAGQKYAIYHLKAFRSTEHLLKEHYGNSPKQ